jgi:methyl-accepting chemotaxis protein
VTPSSRSERACRSATAAKEIKALIEQSVESVESGSALVAEAGKTMSEIVAQVQRVNDLVGEISSASTEQSQGIEQVGDAVTQLDQVTQQNAALVEESAAAADSLKTQAQHLAQAVSVFQVSGAPASVAPVAAMPAPKPVRSFAAARKPVVPAARLKGAAQATAASPAPATATTTGDPDADWTSF